MKRTNIQILRVLCVIVVVLFHTMTRYDNPLIITQTPQWASSLVRIAIWIAVPMFLFISGLLFSSQIRKDRYESWSELCIQKTKHLLLPYVIFTILIMATSGFFDITEIIKGGFWHLWFLPTLFFCFVALYPVLRFSNSIFFELAVLSLTYALSFIKVPTDYCFIGYDGMLKWGFYFVLGYFIGNHERKFQYIMSKYHTWIPLLLIWVVDNAIATTPYMDITWHNTLCVAFGLVSLFYLAGKITLQGKVLRIVETFAAMSFGIYILHYWVLVYATSSTAFRLLGVFEPVNTFRVISSILIITLLTIFVSFYITKILKSFKFVKEIV